jgi:ribonuclease Y
MAIVIGILIGFVAGGVAAALLLMLTGGTRLAAARRTSRLLLDEARSEADALRREAQLAAKEEAVRLREELERDLQTRMAETVRAQERAAGRDAEMERQVLELERREQGLGDREQHARQLQEEL